MMSDETDNLLRQLIDVTRLATIPVEMRYADTRQLGALLGYSARSVAERIACQPDFPQPVRLLGGEARWKVSEVIAWADAQRKPRRARKINQAA
jgi:predicted DNA-binding transcriptional regulator AlpA